MQQRQQSVPVSEPNGSLSEKGAWMQKERVKTLRQQLEDLDKACAQVRHTVYVLRKELGQ
jgi:hypothetical protein